MRSIEDQAVYRFTYAIALLAGAERATVNDSSKPEMYLLPAYLLLGFSLENAFASYLIASRHSTPSDYKSHRLVDAMRACAKHHLVFSKPAIQFVERIDPYHRDFVFRYPEKMEKVLLNIRKESRLTYDIIKDVEVGLKMIGIDPVVQINKPEA